jgi:EmrB/QacA subfamily drug resistance transporter
LTGVSRKTWTLVAVVLGSGVVFLDSTVVTVALPQIGRELPRSFLGLLEGQSYVYYGYLLSLSALLILGGALTDFYGRRRMFAVGLAGFGVTSVLCGLAWSLETLVLFRVLQGASGALLVPGSLSIITATFSGEEQGRAFGVWAGASAATTILGPLVGGSLVAYVSWRAVFLINVPLVAVGLWITRRFMAETRDEEATGRFDWTGAAVAAVAVGGLTFGAIRGQATEWQEPSSFVALGLGLAALVAFPLLMARSSHPLVPLSLFRSRNFTVTNVSTLVIYGALYVVFQYLALFAIGVVGYNEVAFGIATIPGMVFLALFSTRFGALASRLGPRWFMAAGPAIMGLGLLWFARFPRDSAPWVAELGNLGSLVPPRGYLVDVLPALLLFGVGVMVMVAPLTMALMRSVPVRHAGIGSAFNNAISRVGPQLAGALLFIAITASFYAALSAEAPRLDVSAPELRQQVAPLNPVAEDVDADVAAAAESASTDAFKLAMLVGAILCFSGAAINALGIRNEELREEIPAPEPEPVCAPMPGAHLEPETQPEALPP